MPGWRNRQRTEYIVIHCSKTHPDQKDTEGNPVDFRYLDRKHREEGGLSCGYHWVIHRNGDAVALRPLDVPGAHCIGVNDVSVGICLIGGVDKDSVPTSNYTKAQWAALNTLVDSLTRKYPEALVVGHCDINKKNWCPAFDVRHWVAVKKDRAQKEVNERKSEETNPEASPGEGPVHPADHGPDPV